MPAPHETTARRCTDATPILRLQVRNHPGVMSHVCGLFARRGFNLDGIVCVPAGDGTRSVLLLKPSKDTRLEQLTRQLAKLEDVLEIEVAGDAALLFREVEKWLA